MRERVYRYLELRPDGATTNEILDLLFTSRARDPELNSRLIHAYLDDDPRIVWDAALERWRLRRFEILGRAVREAAFTVVDLETTGLTPDPDGIIEIGAARIENGRVVRRFQQLVCPRSPLPPFIVRLTGITPEMLADQPPLADVWNDFVAFASDSVVVAHNAEFDLAYLNLAAQRFAGGPFTDLVLCTLKLARRLLPGLRRRGLDALAEFFGLPLVGRHRAIGDVELTVEIFWRLVELAEQQGVSRLGELLALQSLGADGRPFFSPLPRWQVEALPRGPGVYRFYDRNDRLLYIGRAKDLRRRVGSYLRNSRGHSRKTLDLIRHMHRVEAEPTVNELEAALAEAVAIRREKPPYNRLGKHLPQIAYIRVGCERPFPRVSIARRLRGKRARWIGPFRDRAEAERFLRIVHRTYGFRTCAGKLVPDPSASPCLQGQMRLCAMPCVAAISAEEYNQRLESFLADLCEGSPRLAELITLRRIQAAQEERFEAAQRLQEEVVFVERLRARFATLGWLTTQQHFLLLLPGKGDHVPTAYWIQAGRLVARSRMFSLQQFDSWLDQVCQMEAPSSPEAIDATTIVAGWLRERGENRGYLFRVPTDPVGLCATRDEWRTALQSLLSEPRISGSS